MQCLKWKKLSHILYEKVMRGRISHISNRHNKANNKYLKSFDPKEESKHIYLVTNNLLSYAMSKFLNLDVLQVDSNG